MRKKIVAGNWKMNLLSAEAKRLLDDISNSIPEFNNVELMLFPPSLFLHELAKDSKMINIGAQNFYPADSGAFTGEISITQIKDAGAKYALIGHSERRAIFGEKADLLKQKVNSAIKNNIGVVFCCGEPLEIRENGTELEYVKKQLIDSLFHLSENEIHQCIIAYEPVWAIGTGKTASVQQVEDMHNSIRNWISESYSESLSKKISILYGGSCNPSNASELFACPNVDGGLIGGASLQAESFLQIANSF